MSLLMAPCSCPVFFPEKKYLFILYISLAVLGTRLVLSTVKLSCVNLRQVNNSRFQTPVHFIYINLYQRFFPTRIVYFSIRSPCTISYFNSHFDLNRLNRNCCF